MQVWTTCRSSCSRATGPGAGRGRHVTSRPPSCRSRSKRTSCWLPSAKSSRRRSVGDKRRGDPLGATVGEYTARRQGSPHGPPPFNTPAPVAPGTALVRHGRDARSPLARGSTVDPGTAVIELALVTARPAVGQWLVSHGDLWSWGRVAGG